MSTIVTGRRVEVEVPATSANLGPGFDCLGLGLDLYNSCSFETVDHPGVTVEVVGEGAGRLPTDERNLIVRSLDLGLKRLGWQATPEIEVSLLAQNLFDKRHAEFNAANVASQFGRRLFLKVVFQL